MYGHQVIDDMQRLRAMAARADVTAGRVLLRRMATCCDDIRKAQHFHLGNDQALIEMAKGRIGAPLFFGELGQARLPYPFCWFDFLDNSSNAPNIEPEFRSSKRGLLVKEIFPNLIRVEVFNYMTLPRMWFLSHCAYVVSIDCLLNSIDEVTEMFSQGAQGLDIGFTREQLKGNCFPVPYLPPENTDLNKLWEEDQADLMVLNMGLLLLDCKNIGTEPHHPSPQLQKARKRKGSQPLFSYHTLVIKPVGTGKKNASSHPSGDHNRIHFCRGHFKTYTEESPLFGHIVGRYWWQPHVRGQNKDGVVMKDYSIKRI